MLQKVTKPQMITQTTVCIWIIVCNLIVNLLALPEHGIHYVNWCFFMSNILFFICTEENMKKRFMIVGLGSIVGVVLAALTTLVLALLWTEQGMGGSMSFVPSLMIPLAVSLAILIILHPICPVNFHNYGFVFYLVALTVMENEPWGGNPLSNLPAYIVSLVLGHVIVNGGSLIIITSLRKYFAKKAQKSLNQ